MHLLSQWWDDLTADDEDAVGTSVDGPAWLVSLLIHVAIVVILGTVFMSTPSRDPLTLVTEVDAVLEEEEIPIQEFRFTEPELEDIGSADIAGIEVPAPQAMQLNELTSLRTEELPVEVARYEAPALSVESQAPNLNDAVVMKGNASVGTVGAVGAIDRITQEILLSLEQRPTLVVWLFDQSWSMVPQRQAVQQRMGRIYEELGVSHLVAMQRDKKPLMTSVMAFGKDISIRTPSLTDDVGEIERAIAAIENDDSGIEMTFTAVSKAVETYKYQKIDNKRHIMCVVFTDEVGDDENQLEGTIQLCRRYGASVYVVGAPAPFGRRNVEFKYVDPDPDYDQRVQWLPVRAGPETFFPETVNLGFAGFGERDSDIYRLDSGFGPYCLTRLAYETGGIFFSVHPARPATAEGFVPSNATPAMSARLNYFFDPNIMRAYAPDYLPTQEYQKLVLSNRAREVLVRSAEASMVMQMQTPMLRFPRDPDNEASLKRSLDDAQKSAAILEPRLNELYSILKQGEADRAKLTGLRWQAGYDLALARVLAAKVRTEGYNFMLAKAKFGLKLENPRANELELRASDDVTWGSNYEKMAKQARELFQRIATEHSGTPWAYVAEVELKDPIGWRWVEHYTPPPPPPPPMTVRPANTPPPPPPPNRPRPPLPQNANPKPLRQNIKL